MRWRRVLLGTLGVASLGLALTVADAGPLAAAARTGVETLGNDYLLVAALGALGTLVGLLMLATGRSGNLVQTTTPDPERPPSVPAAGDDFDRTVRSLRFTLPLVGRSARRTVRERLRAAAVEATAHDAGCSRAEAERRVADGTWTDDDAAAAFLATDGGPSAAVGGRLTALVDGETLGQRRARRAADAVVARARGAGPSR